MFVVSPATTPASEGDYLTQTGFLLLMEQDTRHCLWMPRLWQVKQCSTSHFSQSDCDRIASVKIPTMLWWTYEMSIVTVRILWKGWMPLKHKQQLGHWRLGLPSSSFCVFSPFWLIHFGCALWKLRELRLRCSCPYVFDFLINSQLFLRNSSFDDVLVSLF